MPIQTPKMPEVKPDQILAIIAVGYLGLCLYFGISEWQRNRMFKITQDRLTLAYETHVYNEIRKANGPIHEGTGIQPTVADGIGESLSAQDDTGTKSDGYVPYRVGGARSLANVDEIAEGLDNE